MSKHNISVHKPIYDIFSRRSNIDQLDNKERPFGKRVTPKKLVISKKIHSYHSKNGKSCSTGIINDKSKSTVIRPKKTTKSDVRIHQKSSERDSFDICKRCGDANAEHKLDFNSHNVNNNLEHASVSRFNPHPKPNTSKPKLNNPSFDERSNHRIKRSKSLKQCYRNDNFKPSSESVGEIETAMKRTSLDTIKEIPEIIRSVITEDEASDVSDIFNIDTNSEVLGYLDVNDEASIKKLKEFRDKNYFECHSAKSRIESKVSVTSLTDHKCTYRFYLNDRLFPIPISTDHQNNIRCVECHLPMDVKNKVDNKINGAIQAKVKVGDVTRDTVLFLPIKDHLIIKERKKEKKKEDDLFYFGVVKLSCDGNSIFNPNTPSNSLALRYQKGYKEYRNRVYRFENVDQGDVIVI
ncbi:uncharacterized protein LOC113519370 [Galleria mellonella]|uniref:Uncharacterized protein LOC113519370 n=1 Tax=Galleria mellonella TaxID=7137 RepID=A0A6J3BT07_GALME|nr:uncharacterized protein LOC113519370 [Galleria mellonella]